MMKNTRMVRLLWEVRPHRCRWCGNRLFLSEKNKKNSSRSTATLDHLCPLERGGATTMSNGALSCARCNMLRAEANHCIGALACARMVLPYVDPPGIVRRWLNDERTIGETKQKRAHEWDKALLSTEPAPSALAEALTRALSLRKGTGEPSAARSSDDQNGKSEVIGG